MQWRIRRERTTSVSARAPGDMGTAEETALDKRWCADMWTTSLATVAFLGMLIALDTFAGTLNAARSVLWIGLAVLMFLLLTPARVVAGRGWLESRWLWRERLVHTDRLVSARWSPEGAPRLILRDADGGRVEVNPDVLAANPPLWRLVDAGIRASLKQGRLRRGESVLRQLSLQVEKDMALAIFKVSGLQEGEQP
ncbi:hypothetical protein [Streptomyces sp. NPDC127197]|uniref:hypothetical protein n=1 Tax=Streptomyces sp. NPDC127197 TaxID=3345388 RepID=UPI00363293ED